MAEPIQAYLDTCVVSGLAKGDLREPTIVALLRILQLQKKGKVCLTTSSVTEGEIAKIPYKHRVPHQAIYDLLAEVPIAQTHRTSSSMTLMGAGGGTREDPLYTSLKGIVPDEGDANHLFQAAKNGVAYFLTTDERTILKFRDAIVQQSGVRTISAEELVRECEAIG